MVVWISGGPTFFCLVHSRDTHRMRTSPAAGRRRTSNKKTRASRKKARASASQRRYRAIPPPVRRQKGGGFTPPPTVDTSRWSKKFTTWTPISSAMHPLWMELMSSPYRKDVVDLKNEQWINSFLHELFSGMKTKITEAQYRSKKNRILEFIMGVLKDVRDHAAIVKRRGQLEFPHDIIQKSASTATGVIKEMFQAEV